MPLAPPSLPSVGAIPAHRRRFTMALPARRGGAGVLSAACFCRWDGASRQRGRRLPVAHRPNHAVGVTHVTFRCLETGAPAESRLAPRSATLPP